MPFNSDELISHTECFATQSDISPIHIAWGFDDRYAMPAGVSALSVIKNNPDSYFYFHFFVDNVSTDNIDKLKQLISDSVSVNFYYVNNKFQINPETLVVRLPASSCVRFIMPDILMHYTERFLYLDSDTLCLGNIAPLYQFDIQNMILGVIPDDKGSQLMGAVGFDIDRSKYFNSGVLLVDITKWRTHDITKKCMSMINDGRVYRFADQDVLNIVLEHQTYLLPIKYNTKIKISTDGHEERMVRPYTVILHYVTMNKPWLMTYQSQLYDHYFYLSPWKNDNKPFAYKTSSIRHYASYCLKRGDLVKAIKTYIAYLKRRLANGVK